MSPDSGLGRAGHQLRQDVPAFRMVLVVVLVISFHRPGMAGAQAKEGVPPMTSRAARLPVEGNFPSLAGASTWLNSPPLTAAELHGKVVLVDFWTYTCINWLRTAPYLRAWAAKYKDQGLVVIGVHAPEFAFEHDLDNVRRMTASLTVTYPVAVDNDHTIWRAFANNYWPALYFIDAEGHIRHHQFGEGEYEQSERVIQQLLAESGRSGGGHVLVAVEPQGAEVAADWASLKSPENYLGTDRTENFDPAGGMASGRRRVYGDSPHMGLNHWTMVGDWTAQAQSVRLNLPGGKIVYQFHARDLNLVMGPAAPATSVRFRVTVDGKAPGAAHGGDVDADGIGTMTEQRMYQLIRQGAPIVDRTFEIEFLDAGAEALAFTFG